MVSLIQGHSIGTQIEGLLKTTNHDFNSFYGPFIWLYVEKRCQLYKDGVIVDLV